MTDEYNIRECHFVQLNVLYHAYSILCTLIYYRKESNLNRK